MPSLSELRKFKASFASIGGQQADMRNRKIPFDDLELPAEEPEALTPPESVPPKRGADSVPEMPPPLDEIDFSGFMGAQASDLPDLPAPNAELLSETDPADSDDSLDLDSTDDFAFPEEASPEDTAPALDLDSLDNFAFPEEASPEDTAPALDLDSLDNFDFPEEPIPQSKTAKPDIEGLDNFDFLEELVAADAGESPVPDTLEDFKLPEEAPLEEAPAEEDVNIPVEESENLDLDAFDNLELPSEEIPTDEGEDFDLSSIDDFNMPAEESENLDLDSLDNLELPSEEVPAGEGEDFEIPAEESENIDLDSLDNLELPSEEIPVSEEDFDLEALDDFAIPAEEASSDDTDSSEEVPAGEDADFDLGAFDDFASPAEEAPSNEFDDFAVTAGETPADDTIELDDFNDIFSDSTDPAAEGTDAGDDFDDFALPDLDILPEDQDRTKTAAAVKGAGKGRKWLWGRKKNAAERTFGTAEKIIPEDVEELQLSDDELEGLQETLSRYPINLRIACEEIIVEQVIDPKLMSDLIEHLVWGASAQETAAVVSRILGRTIIVPKAFEKSTGEALEAEQSSFAYIFVHNFLPTLRIILFVSAVAASLFYLLYKFAYIPLKAESIYQTGYERIFAGEYQRANERFTEAFEIHRKRDWFFKYAEAFRDERQYLYAEQKYDELLHYYPRNKKAVLDYAAMETNHLRNYAKADSILRRQLLDYAPNDQEGLLAAGDNSLMWGEIDPSKYEDARYSYARLLEKYGWKGPVVERMMKYFIRTDQLKEVLSLRTWFDNNTEYRLSPVMLGELGGYLLDKKLEEARGVPNEYIEHIDRIRDLLLDAIYTDPALPEPHYHLARYYQSLGNTSEERVTLRIAVRAFEDAPEESIRRLNYRIDAHQRYADSLMNNREFIPAEEQLVKGINLYEDAISRRLMSHTPQYGRLYAGLGDLEYFTKTGDMEAALRDYRRAEENGWAPPEMQYRMGSAYYQLEDWKNALEYLFAASSSLPLNRRILFAMGNAALKRGDAFAANGYYNRLLDILENQRARLPVLLPNDRPEYLELAERLMMARNNAGAACEMLAAQTGNRNYHTRALSLYAESERAWDARTRDPASMIRSGSTPLPYLNMRNALYPNEGYEPQIFIRIDREALENSPWGKLAPLPRLDMDR